MTLVMFYIHVTMKWKALIVLLAIAFSVVLPPSLPYLSDNGAIAAIGTLDVCHSATPALSSNGDMPCVTASICIAAPLLAESTNDSLQKTYSELILSSRNEQPPRS